MQAILKETSSSIRSTTDHCLQFSARLMGSAGQELAAFGGAVHELYGAEQAQQSAEDWIDELESMDWPAGGGTPDWRRVTIAAAVRLARRVTADTAHRITANKGDDLCSEINGYWL
jgi:hypothetical protein